MTVRVQKKGQDMRPTDDYEDDNIVSKVENNLQSINDDSADSTPEPEDQRRGDEPTEPKDSDDSADSTPKDKVEDEEEFVLPERLLRAAIHQGWESESAVEFFKDNPEKALKVFEKIYESTNRLSKQWANLGRTKSQPQQPKEQSQVQQPKVEEPKYKGIDINKIREEHGNDPLVNVVEQLDTALKAALNVPKQEPAPVVSTQDSTPSDTFSDDMDLWQDVNSFFGDSSLNEYGEVYGPGKTEQGRYINWRNLTPGQYQNRMAVLERAEQILVGAELQGEQISTIEAMNLAHLLVTEPIREQIIRSKIKAGVKQRNKGITLKPSDSRQVSTDGKPKTEEELEAKTAERLANLDW